MKLALLAAVAVIATPVLAQETPGTAPMDQPAPAADPSATDTTVTATDSTVQAPDGSTTNSTTTTQTTTTAPTMPTDPGASDPAGGYQPSTTSAGPAQPGAQVTFQPAPSPAEAFPPPPPMKKYPICKKGQYDNCMQRGGR